MLFYPQADIWPISSALFNQHNKIKYCLFKWEWVYILANNFQNTERKTISFAIRRSTSYDGLGNVSGKSGAAKRKDSE